MPFASYSTGMVSVAGALPSVAGSPPVSNTATILAPVQSAATTSATGGTLAAATYYYKVTALTAAGETVGSNEQSIATSGTTSSNVVTWAAVTGATGYRVYRGTAAAGENIYYTAGNVTTFTDTGAASTAGSTPVSNTATLPAPTQSAPMSSPLGGNLAAATYYYKITALNAAGETVASTEQSIATTGNTSSNSIAWAAVTGASGYRVYRGTASGGENSYFAPGNVTTFTDIGSAATTVTGSGTVWSGINARPGDLLQIGSEMSFISDVTDTSHLVIPPFGGSAVSASAYTIYQTSPLRFAGGQAMADVAALVAVLNGMGTIYAVTGTLPDPSIGTDGQYALKTNTTRWQLWLRVSGAWVLQGTPVGVSYRSDINSGVYSSAFSYAVGDMVTSVGTLYISNVASNLNNTPASSPTQWSTAAAAGTNGTNGATWTSGAVAPSGGNDGDFYLLTTTEDVYRRSSGAWTVIANIKGNTGNTGGTGLTGTAATIVVNSTTTLSAGNPATVTNLGTSSAASLVFSIPAGPQGIQGIPGNQGVGLQPDASGTFAGRSAFDGQTTGYKYLETDVSPFRLFVKASNSSGDWAGPTYIGGNFPVGDMGHITDSIVQTFDFGHIV
jgi:hypothetical protein